MSKLLRVETALAGLWAGLLVGVGAVSAPSLFEVLDRASAGAGAGQIFSVEARISLGLAIMIFLIERRRVRDEAERTGAQQVMTAHLLLVLGALFLTVFGQFALHPMMAAAKAGQPTALSFGTMHGISAVMYWFKAVLVMVLAWRLSAPLAAG